MHWGRYGLWCLPAVAWQQSRDLRGRQHCSQPSFCAHGLHCLGAARSCFPSAPSEVSTKLRPAGAISAGAAGADPAAQSTSYTADTRTASPLCATSRVASDVPAWRTTAGTSHRHAAAACPSLAEGRACCSGRVRVWLFEPTLQVEECCQ